MALVCGTDFSPAARPALLAAAALASRIGGGELVVVAVISDSLDHAFTPSQKRELEVALQTKLDGATKELAATHPSVRIRSKVLTGPVATTLSDFAARENADLLVVGSQGHSQSSMLRLGGTSERVAFEAAVPVLVVRDEGPFVAWSRKERALRVLLGVDWTVSCTPAIELVKTLRRGGACDVVVGHVYFGGESTSRYGLAGTHSWLVSDPKTEELLRRDLALRVGDLGGDGTVTYEPTLGIGRLGGHLIDLAEAQKADLIVVGSHQRGMPMRLASVSSVVLHHAHSSVACAPPRPRVSSELPEIRRVLIPTDFSPLSLAAIAHGYSLLTGRRDGEVYLLHVGEPGVTAGDPATETPELIAKLRALVPPWAAHYGITTHTEVLQRTDAAKTIRGVAARVGADVICMASHGRSGLGRAVLGSVTEEVIREETRPVLVVRQPR